MGARRENQPEPERSEPQTDGRSWRMLETRLVTSGTVVNLCCPPLSPQKYGRERLCASEREEQSEKESVWERLDSVEGEATLDQGRHNSLSP